MVIPINRPLFDLNERCQRLVNHVARKVANRDLSFLNDNFKLAVNEGEIRTLCSTIQSRLRKTEMISVAFFSTINHALLCGNAADLPFGVEAEFTYDTFVVTQTFSVNDRIAYQEMIENNFQTFILTIAALLENLVRLQEILVRKVILFSSRNVPTNTPFAMYAEYMKILVDLNYKQRDEHSDCFTRNTAFIDQYVNAINILRNRFIHGYKSHVVSDGEDFVVDIANSDAFPQNSPLLIIDKFVGDVYDSIKSLTTDLFDSLIVNLQNPETKIPS